MLFRSIDERIWNSVEYGWEKPAAPVNEWQTSEKEAAAFNSKVIDAIYNTVSIEEFKKISNVEVVHIAWNILQTMHEAPRQLRLTNCSS